MSVKTRALIVGFVGPAIQAIGITWTLLHLLIVHVHEPLSTRHIVFETPFLLIFVGFLLSLVCIPVALEVARATEEEVALPLFGSEEVEEAELRQQTQI
jgi:hypothetical protein